MYNIELSKEVQKDLKSLPKKEAEIILKKIYSIRENPLHFIERLKRILLWKLRIGNYRAIIKIITKTKTIYVIKIGHRNKIYK